MIIFSNHKARERLLKKGIVYTFRVRRRRKLGRDWATDRYGGKKICNVMVFEVGSYAPKQLYPFVKESGFNSLDEWVEEIKSLNDGLPETGWLYLVVKEAV